jgi:SSS family solute:Na+ symporter
MPLINSQQLPLTLWMGCYFLGILLLAAVFSRKIETLKDFFLAGRSLGAWPVTLTFVASWFGAASTIGSMNGYHETGVQGAWLLAIPSLVSCTIITVFFSRKVADQNTLSQPEAIEHAYGRFGRFLLSFTILGACTTLMASQLVAAGALCHHVLGLDLAQATCWVTLAVVIYSMAGGYFAVVVTDIAQFVLFTLALLILLGHCLLQAQAQPDFYHALFQETPASFWDLGENLPHNLSLLLTFILAWSIAPEMWQRMTSTRNRELSFQSAQWATLILGGLFLIVAAIGLFSKNLVSQPDNVLVRLAFQLPDFSLTAFVLVGVMAAITSTMDSSLNVGSLTVSRDLYQGFIRPQASERETLWVSRLATLFVPLPAIGIALYYQNIIQVLWISADIYASTMFFPIVGILFLKNIKPLAGILAMLGGGSVIVLSLLQTHTIIPFPFSLPPWPYTTLIGVSVSGLGYLVGQLLGKPKAANSITESEL